jgi:hypothetical protein
MRIILLIMRIVEEPESQFARRGRIVRSHAIGRKVKRRDPSDTPGNLLLPQLGDGEALDDWLNDRILRSDVMGQSMLFAVLCRQVVDQHRENTG